MNLLSPVRLQGAGEGIGAQAITLLLSMMAVIEAASLRKNLKFWRSLKLWGAGKHNFGKNLVIAILKDWKRGLADLFKKGRC